jgi:hypothetical protein
MMLSEEEAEPTADIWGRGTLTNHVCTKTANRGHDLSYTIFEICGTMQICPMLQIQYCKNLPKWGDEIAESV